MSWWGAFTFVTTRLCGRSLFVGDDWAFHRLFQSRAAGCEVSMYLGSGGEMSTRVDISIPWPPNIRGCPVGDPQSHQEASEFAGAAGAPRVRRAAQEGARDRSGLSGV